MQNDYIFTPHHTFVNTYQIKKEIKMLKFSRTIGQAIYILDGQIKVEIISIRRGQVRIGITAARHIDVHREEIYKRIQNSFLTANQ